MKEKIRTHKVHRLYQKDKKVPFISLSGKWLQDNGFNIGDNVKISLGKDMLLIVKEN